LEFQTVKSFKNKQLLLHEFLKQEEREKQNGNLSVYFDVVGTTDSSW
jgi:hypothetical protein